MVGEQVQRIVFNLRGLPTRRDPLSGTRTADSRRAAGTDGLLYVLTEEDDGALLRFEPV